MEAWRNGGRRHETTPRWGVYAPEQLSSFSPSGGQRSPEYPTKVKVKNWR